MATATSKQVTVVVLELDEYETRWLRALLQNPLHGKSPREESMSDQHNRIAIFNALNQKPS